MWCKWMEGILKNIKRKWGVKPSFIKHSSQEQNETRFDTSGSKAETMLLWGHISSVAQVGCAARAWWYPWIIQHYAVRQPHAAIGVVRPCGNTHKGGRSASCFFALWFVLVVLFVLLLLKDRGHVTHGFRHKRWCWRRHCPDRSRSPHVRSRSSFHHSNIVGLYLRQKREREWLFNIWGQPCTKWPRSQLTVADGQQQKKSENNSLHVEPMWQFFTQVSAQRDEERVEKTHTGHHDPGFDAQILPERTRGVV